MSWLIASGVAALSAPLGCPVGDERDLGCARGFSGRERDALGAFRWSAAQATVLLHDDQRPAQLSLTLAAPRPDGGAPAVMLAAGGYRIPLTPDPRPRRLVLLFPQTPTQLQITSDTFAASDGRDLGVKVYAVTQETSGVARPSVWVILGLLGIGWLGMTVARSWQDTSSPPGLRSRWLRQAQPTRERGRVSWQGAGPPLAGTLAMLLAAAVCVWLPERTVPFMPAAGGIAALLALTHRRWGTLRIPAALLLALLAGAALDALIVAQAVPRSALPLVLGAQLAVLLTALRWAWQRWEGALAPLLGIALLVRLLGFAVRLLAAQAASDPDTQLFYSYGRAALELGVPLVEYPSGALIPWMLLALPGSAELFTLTLPLFNLLCDLAIVWGIWTLGRSPKLKVESLTFEVQRAAIGAPRASTLLPLCYALSPLLLPFWHGKYDSLPAALLVVGLALWWRGRNFWSGAALGFGGAVKWVPWLALPFLVVGAMNPLGRSIRMRWIRLTQWSRAANASPVRDALPNAALLVAGFLLAVAAASLPFALRDLATFLAPYRLQGGRPMIGESVWFPLAALLDPGLLKTIDKPWSGVRNAPIGREVMVGAQALALLALGIAQLRTRSAARTVCYAALAPAVFLLLNRVYSPQYILIITACALAAAAALRVRRPLLLCGLLALAQSANLLVWPNTMPWWLWPSVVQFVALIAALGLLVLPQSHRATEDAQSF